ncbi:hypothetical protein [Kitasatospora sp. MBT66]|uniref:hypothetical protein n=1 Tax=Kitasatospora sp. MBT66 TaxID=1444769 RepID=UPI0005B993A8|nr:hypothetical protein [Kitasatospora sp. MBT66]
MPPPDQYEDNPDTEILEGELVSDEPGTQLAVARAPATRQRPPQVRQIGLIRSNAAGSFARFEFSDTSKRGPDRRELAISLAHYFKLTPVRHPVSKTWTEDTGHEVVNGALRATSRTRERIEMRAGRGRTDLELEGEAEALAAFAEVLPDALAALDRLSAAGGALYRRQLKTLDQAEYLMTPQEQPGAVQRWRREFSQALAGATGRRAVPVELVHPGTFLHGQAETAAATALAELGPRWLEGPSTAAAAIRSDWLERARHVDTLQPAPAHRTTLPRSAERAAIGAGPAQNTGDPAPAAGHRPTDLERSPHA